MPGYDGQQIMICGRLELGPKYCTKMACSTVNPCCNTCGAGYRFDDLVSVAGTTDGDKWGCGGNECSLTCTPFEDSDVDEHRCYYGTFIQSGFGSYGVLDVQGFENDCSL